MAKKSRTSGGSKGVTTAAPSTIDSKVQELELRLRALELPPTALKISSLFPSALILKHPIPVVICRNDDDYRASFFDANIHATGDSEQEAFDGLRDVIIAKFELYDAHDLSRLGPDPLRQLSVMKQFIGRA